MMYLEVGREALMWFEPLLPKSAAVLTSWRQVCRPRGEEPKEHDAVCAPPLCYTSIPDRLPIVMASCENEFADESGNFSEFAIGYENPSISSTCTSNSCNAVDPQGSTGIHQRGPRGYSTWIKGKHHRYPRGDTTSRSWRRSGPCGCD